MNSRQLKELKTFPSRNRNTRNVHDTDSVRQRKPDISSSGNKQQSDEKRGDLDKTGEYSYAFEMFPTSVNFVSDRNLRPALRVSRKMTEPSGN